MRVWYFHGLESQQGGPKVDFLQTRASEVFAPTMDYKNPELFDTLLKKARETAPDLLIGSSMGGYFADAISSHTGIPVLLFNPALHSRSIDIQLNYGNAPYVRHFVVGCEDEVINPEQTQALVKKYASFQKIPGMGHRTSLEVFISSFNNTVQTLTS